MQTQMNFGFEKIPRAFLLGATVILVGAVAAVWWLFADESVVLFDQLDAQSVNAVSAELDRAGIAYAVDRESGAISVAPEVQQRARLAVMSSQNAFNESVGFELFDGSDFGMTEFAQKINHQRAIEGELARTISALDEIKYARVHLVLPEHGLFRDRDRAARASITVFAENGAQLTAAQIRGLQRIATAAVPELQEQNVTVTDERGRVLSSGVTQDESGGDVDSRLAQKRSVEQYLAEKARAVLTRALGAERFAVSVDVALDYDRKTTRTERVLEAGAGSGMSRLKETTRENEGAALDRVKEVEYSIGRELEEVAHASGAIRRVQVGVIIDRSLENVDINQLSALVAAAVGVDTARGDNITVVQHGVALQEVLERAIEPAAAAPSTPAALESSSQLSWAWLAALLAFATLIVAGLLHRLRTVRERRRVEQLRVRLQHWVDAQSLSAVSHEHA